jgi:hypothetical protein
MAEARLKQELVEMKTELDKLKEKGSSGTYTVHKDIPDIPGAKMVRCGKCHPTGGIFSQQTEPC